MDLRTDLRVVGVMGADMLLTLIAHRHEVEIDPAAGHAYVQGLGIDESLVQTIEAEGGGCYLEDHWLDDDPEQGLDLEGVRQWLLEAVDRIVEALGGRHVAELRIGDYCVYAAGGLSWGDRCGDEQDMADVMAVPGLAAAMGFDLDWWDHPSQPATAGP